MNNQIANGIPLKGEEAVAADAIAKLSGVSGGSVVKVLMALHAVNLSMPQHSLADLVNIDNLPSEAADSPARFDATDDFVDRVVHQMQKQPLRWLADKLRLNRRFSKAA